MRAYQISTRSCPMDCTCFLDYAVPYHERGADLCKTAPATGRYILFLDTAKPIALRTPLSRGWITTGGSSGHCLQMYGSLSVPPLQFPAISRRHSTVEQASCSTSLTDASSAPHPPIPHALPSLQRFSPTIRPKMTVTLRTMVSPAGHPTPLRRSPPTTLGAVPLSWDRLGGQNPRMYRQCRAVSANPARPSFLPNDARHCPIPEAVQFPHTACAESMP